MTMESLPEVIRRVDLANLVQTAQSVSSSPLTSGDPSQWFDMIETALKFADRFNVQLEKAVSTINGVKEMGATVQQTGQQGINTIDDGPAQDYQAPYRPPAQEVIADPPPTIPTPPTEPTSTPRIPAIKIYALALNGLSQLPQEWTIGKALEMARDNKSMILPMIEKEMDRLIAENDRPQ
jgi:uncharacterized phage infection (PIP) family protein YhgE